MAQLKFKIKIEEFKYYFAAFLVMLTIGIVLYSNLFDNVIFHKRSDYPADIYIDNNQTAFQNYNKNSLGNALVYGEIKALDPVTFEEIGGEYSHVVKITEKRKKSVPDKGDIIIEWVPIDSLSRWSRKITFLNEELLFGAIEFPAASYVTTKYAGEDIRHVYYGTDVSCMGTAYATKENGETKFNRVFYNRNIEETLRAINTSWMPFGFWCFWIAFLSLCLQGMYFVHMKIKQKHKKKNIPLPKENYNENIYAPGVVCDDYNEEVIYPEEFEIQKCG